VFIQLHGDEATAKARDMVKQMLAARAITRPLTRGYASAWRSGS
jgi:hypothetical protein